MEQYLNERSALAESFGILADVMYGFHVFWSHNEIMNIFLIITSIMAWTNENDV